MIESVSFQLEICETWDKIVRNRQLEEMAASAGNAPSGLDQYEKDYALFKRNQDEIKDERYRINSKIEQLKRVSELSAIVGGMRAGDCVCACICSPSLLSPSAVGFILFVSCVSLFCAAGFAGAYLAQVSIPSDGSVSEGVLIAFGGMAALTVRLV